MPTNTKVVIHEKVTSKGPEGIRSNVLLIFFEEPFWPELIRIREKVRVVVAGIDWQIHSNALLDDKPWLDLEKEIT